MSEYFAFITVIVNKAYIIKCPFTLKYNSDEHNWKRNTYNIISCVSTIFGYYKLKLIECRITEFLLNINMTSHFCTRINTRPPHATKIFDDISLYVCWYLIRYLTSWSWHNLKEHFETMSNHMFLGENITVSWNNSTIKVFFHLLNCDPLVNINKGFLVHTSVAFHEITSTDSRKWRGKVLHIDKIMCIMYVLRLLKR